MNNEKEKNMGFNKETSKKKTPDPALPTKENSMGNLIIWNITKAKEISPKLELQTALKNAQNILEQEADVTAIVSQQPVDRHLSCALLAWQQLGHERAESLCRFVETRMRQEETEREKLRNALKIAKNSSPPSSPSYSKDSYITGEGSFDSGNYMRFSNSAQMGPVLMLPQEQKVVMHSQVRCKNLHNVGKDLRRKIEEACCLEKGCMEKLSVLSKQSKELEARLAKLTKREQERVMLLERAEAAWRDLEIGYLRRHRATIEKEEDLTRQGNKVLDERNNYKEICMRLVEQLKPRAEAAEKFREQLKDLENQVCAAAVDRLKLVDRVACQDAILSGIHCKVTQQDRDLQFKEDQARRKKQTKEGELESTSALLYDTERTMRAELNALRQQVTNVSNELVAQDEVIGNIKKEIEDFQEEKAEITEDLEGCQITCDKAMQGMVDGIRKKRETLQELKEKVIECKCQLPQDAVVEVKRTASLAALCQCAPEDRALVSCSCTSFRSKLLSDLLKELFGGLQSELGSTTVKMPCQLLKCLEDRHNWDKPSVTKTNLRNFFARLLVGELDITIANSIEKYHAKWVGGTCADIARTIPNEDELESAGWEDRAIALKAQLLAGKIATKLYEEKAAELIERAKDIVAMGPPPCDCKPQSSSKDSAVFRCMIQQPINGSAIDRVMTTKLQTRYAFSYWQRTHNDVTCLRAQIAELQKETIKKGDLKGIEKNIAKIVQQATTVSEEKPDKLQSHKTHRRILSNETPELDKSIKDSIMLDKGFTPSKIIYIEKSATNDMMEDEIIHKKYPSTKKKIHKIKRNRSPDKNATNFLKRQYAVNVCFCGSHRGRDKFPKTASVKPKLKENNTNNCKDGETSSRQKLGKGPSKENTEGNTKKKLVCGNDCACFNTVPSCTSIDELMNTLTKWKSDINDFPYNINKEYKTKSPKLKNPIENIPINNDKNLKKNLNDEEKNTSATKLLSISHARTAYANKSNIDQISKNDNIVLSVSQNHPKNTYDGELSPQLITTVESEYIGAVNLEKSNDNYCKGVISNEKEKGYLNQVNQNITLRQTSCSKHVLNNVQSEKDLENVVKYSNIIKKSANYDTPPAIESFKAKIVTTPILSPVERFNENYDLKDDYFDKPSELSVCDCGYQINFLGVTLANVISNRKMENTPKESNDENTDNLTRSRKPIKYSINPCYPPITMEGNDVILSYPEPVCHCNAKLDELKSFFEGVLNNDNKQSNQDKSLDTKSFIFSLLERENCVCCNNSVAKESSDLEVNTFHLLEDHLKKKFEELKENCKDLCIEALPLEEDKIFTQILQKIKHIIIESTEKVFCKCSGEAQREGSWQRAHGLLQEYLKSKINRIQCSCYLPIQSKENILPDLTEKVCLLIENDFKRLKELCQCQNTNNLAESNQSTHVIEDTIYELPERDTNSTNFERCNHNINVVKSNNLFSNSPIVMTQQTSVQMLPNLETKSCEAMEKGDFMNMIAVETQKSDTNGRQCMSEFITCDILNDQKAIVEEGTQPSNSELVLNTEVESSENQSNENVMKTVKCDKNASLPFIGYTINCSCNSDLGRCVCSKSLVQANNDVIDNIWKTYAINKPDNESLSYIMKSASNKKIDDVNYVKVCDHLFMNKLPNSTSKLCETSDNSDWNMTLKESWEHINVKMRPNFTNTVEEDRLSSGTIGTDEPGDWYECASQTGNEMSGTKSVHFPINKLAVRPKTEIDTNNTSIIPETYEGCECSMVPICHVKMLMENIENKLVNSECTCDALTYQVCPIHSRKNLF